jgi:ATP-dependent Clp protease protease subunit
MIFPLITESSSKGERTYDIYSRLLKDRIIFLAEEINDDVASSVIAQLLFLQLEDDSADIDMYIMSPGGSVSAGLAIYDTMQYVKNDIATYCMGQAASMGAFLLAAGSKGKRFSLPSSRIMIHQPWGGAEGDAKNIQIVAKEINRLKRLLYEHMAHHTGQDVKKIGKDCDRDFYMSAAEALEYGLIDEILSKPRRRRV